VSRFDAEGPGNQKPQTRIIGSDTQLSDPRAAVEVIGKSILGHVAVANAGSDSVTMYTDDGIGASVNQKPVTVIAGAATKLDGPSALGLDALGHLAVANAGDGALRVFGAGAHGDAAPSRSVTGLTDPGGTGVLAAAPGAPTAVTTAPANHALDVSWHAPSNTGGGILGYQVIVSNENPGGGFSFGSSVNFVTTKTHIIEKHLKNGHRYFVSVFAVNEAGQSPFSAFRRGTPATTPGAPRAVKLTPHSNELTVAWKAPKHNGGRKISRYTVQFASCTIGAKGCHAPSISVKGTHHGLKLKGLSGGTAYHVVITARNSLGAGTPSQPVTGTPAT
jgi:hypothetical protein